jgi:hypothetical protein
MGGHYDGLLETRMDGLLCKLGGAGHSQPVTRNNYNILNISVNISVSVTHRIISSRSACWLLLRNESCPVKTPQLNTKLLNCLLNYLTKEFLTELNF